jgi:hypothetical protein
MKQLTDQEGKKMKVIDNYEKGVENSDESLLKEVFASQVRIEIPTGTTNNYSEHSILYPESGRQNRSSNKMRFIGRCRKQLVLSWL